MHKIVNIFRKTKVVLPVIHTIDEKQALENMQLAFDAKADGVFLINHSISSKKLLEIYRIVREIYYDKWIGLNLLDKMAYDVFENLPNDVNGIWVDNAMINEENKIQNYAELINDSKKRNNFQGLYFGGVAFKYQRKVSDYEKAASIASNYMDIVTTSGPGTGKEASIEKIKIMKNAIGDVPLAIASGITPANVTNYLPYADCFIVATGISKDFNNLEYNKTKKLVEIVNDYENNILN